MKSQENIIKEESVLREEIRNLPDDMRKEFYSKIEDRIKDPDTYAVLNWFFIAGIHHFYLQKWLNGFINIGIFIIGILFLCSGSLGFTEIGIVLLLMLFIVESKQLFKSQQIVQDYNNMVTRKVLDELKINKS